MVQACKIGVVTDDTPMDDLMYRMIVNHTLSRIAAGMEESETEEDETESLDSLKHLPYWWV